MVFRLTEELGHVEGVDWDLGHCTACGAPLLRQWSEYRPDRVFVDALSEAEAEAFRAAPPRERLLLLKRWYADH